MRDFDDILECGRIELEKWEHASNYIGEDLSEYYIVFGQHRDSNFADQSNFIIALQRLGGESDESENPQLVRVAHFRNWLVGWNEMLLVHESAEDKLELARKIVYDIENELILDWKHYSEIKSDSVKDFVEEIKQSIADGDVKRWSCYGITGHETDEELYEFADDHIN